MPGESKAGLVQDITNGVYRNTIPEHLIVKVRAGASSGLSNLSYHLAPLHELPLAHVELMQMAVSGQKIIAVVDRDHYSAASDGCLLLYRRVFVPWDRQITRDNA